MKRYFAVTFFVFSMLPGRSQEYTADVNQLRMQLTQSKTDTGRLNTLIQLSGYYFDRLQITNHMDSAAFYLNKAEVLNRNFHVIHFQNAILFLNARRYCVQHPSEDPKISLLPVIDSCKKTGDKHNEMIGWNELGRLTKIDSMSLIYRLTCYQNAMALARQLGDDNMELRSLGNIASVQIRQRKFDLAEKELLPILNDEKKAGAFNSMITCWLLADLNIRRGTYEKALQFSLKTQHWMPISGDTARGAKFCNQLSEIYYILGKADESIIWAKKALEYEIADNNISASYLKINNIAYLLLENGTPKEALAFIQSQMRRQKPIEIADQRKMQETLGDTYNALKMYDEAEKSYVEMIRLGNLQTTNFPDDEKGYENCNMGSFYFRRGNYKKALPFLKVAIKYYEAARKPADTRIAHLWLFKTDSALGNYFSAIDHLKESQRLNDSIFNIARSKQVEQLQVAYHTEQKDKSIKLLGEKEKLAQVQLQHTKSIRNWIVAGASMLLIIAGLLYRQTVVRKKNNELISDKNKQLQHLVTEKEWLLKEVHHRVKNNLHTVISLLESQATYLEDDALQANEISKHRIYAMSLIHQQLYKADNIKTVDMSVFLPELLDYLSESFGTERKIQFRRDITAIKLGVSQAIPVALIVNEAITNSIKYAFAVGQPGIISISIHQSGDNISLVIADNGKGIDPSIIHAETTSMGLKLIKGLTGEMDGEINIVNENGTRISISFGVDRLNEMDEAFMDAANDNYIKNIV